MWESLAESVKKSVARSRKLGVVSASQWKEAGACLPAIADEPRKPSGEEPRDGLLSFPPTVLFQLVQGHSEPQTIPRGRKVEYGVICVRLVPSG
jgi:CxxC motif-containing protein (DUF1111 family)